MRDRAGKSGVGCLGSVVIVILVIWLGGRFISPVIHYLQFRDEMKANARFGTTLADSVIRMRLVAQADTLGLPSEAKRIVIRRRAGRPPTISISATYSVTVNMPIFGPKILHFKPAAEEPL